MNFLTQRILKFSIGIGACCQIPIGLAKDWVPEAAIRVPIAEDSIDLGRFVHNLHGVAEAQRSEWIFEALQGGYVPEFLRHLQPIHAQEGGHQLSFWVMPDYLSIGDNDNFLHALLSGDDALHLAASWNMYLPTRKMVDLIYQQAALLLPAEPLSIDVIKDPMKLWLQHEESMDRELQQVALQSGWLQAGHMKDLVMSPRLLEQRDRAAIYGWQGTEDRLLQNLATSISKDYSDYSMGLRLVAPYCLVDGRWMTVAEVLRNEELSPLLSDEGTWDVERLLQHDGLSRPPELNWPRSLLVEYHP